MADGARAPIGTEEPMTAEPRKPGDPDSLVGSALGPYSVCAEIGRGGMAVVYRAVHSKIHRPVAVKVVAKDKANDPWMLSRFYREAQALKDIQHEGLVKVFDYLNLPDGRPYMVMELIHGDCLRDRIQPAGMAISDAVRFGRQIAGVLAAVHAGGVVHRDQTLNIFPSRN